MAFLFWIFLDQICPKWIKLDQTYIYRKDMAVIAFLQKLLFVKALDRSL